MNLHRWPPRRWIPQALGTLAGLALGYNGAHRVFSWLLRKIEDRDERRAASAFRLLLDWTPCPDGLQHSVLPARQHGETFTCARCHANLELAWVWSS